MTDSARPVEWHALFEALLNEAITPEQHAELEQLLKSNAQARQDYLDHVDLHLGLRTLVAAEEKVDPLADILRLEAPACPSPSRSRRRPWRLASMAAAAAFVGAVVTLLVRPPVDVDHIQVAQNQHTQVSIAPSSEVLLTQSAGAKFFGELPPAIHDSMKLGHEYALTAGMVELTFPDGATAILEAPAVFRIASSDRLKLDVGRCSVHAPDGAEGFRVETPVTDVVDLGTRFTVNVSETSQTAVQVVEGIADVYSKESPATVGTVPTRLTGGQARRFLESGQPGEAVLPFDPEAYRQLLPDRIISYTAKESPKGGVDDLSSVTVQRGGIEQTYNVGDLIGVELISFCSAAQADPSGHLVARPDFKGDRRDTLSKDVALNSGVLNPGGAVEPLTNDPVILDPRDPTRPNTPGMAIRFRKPVVNGPGPDIVFFELQTISNPPDGDAFHVSPLVFEPGLRSHTVRHYDITMSSAEALRVAAFQLYRCETPVLSMSEFLAADLIPNRIHLRFKALAVGVDLSDLGYVDGAKVSELFIADAGDNGSTVDPVFIGGLPQQKQQQQQQQQQPKK